MLTVCDDCGFTCDAVWIGDGFEFRCDICRTLAEVTFTTTETRTETYAEWSERNAASDTLARETFATVNALLASLSLNTTRVFAQKGL